MSKAVAFLVGLLLLAPPPLAAAERYRPPRAASGQPDLEGLWTNAALTRVERPDVFPTVVVPLEAAKAFESGSRGKPPLTDDVGQADTEWWELGGALARIDGEARSAWVVDPADGRLPYSEEGRRLMAAPPPGFDGPESRPPMERCLTAIGTPVGPPMLNAPYNNNYQIVQSRGEVAIVVEMNHDVRIIRLGGRHPPPSVRTWGGDSIGRWDGETLVAETTNFHPAESVRGAPSIGRFFISPDATVVERFTRTGADEIRYEATVEDPRAYVRPWRLEMALRRTKGPMFEFACHEGNYSLPGILAGARAAEAAARNAASAAPPKTAP